MKPFACVLVGLFVTFACSESPEEAPPRNDPDAGAGSGGTAGASGSAGQGGKGGSAGKGGSGGSGECVPQDPNGPNATDPESLGTPTCPTNICASGGHCVPNSLVPAASQSLLAKCDADNFCVPDIFIRTNGQFVPKTCNSVGGAEGRCLSKCIPTVAEQAETLPQDVCAADELCTPCYDPISGTSTQACEQCGDAPAEPKFVFPDCCGGKGRCVPISSVGEEQAAELPVEDCGAENVCAPGIKVADPAAKFPTCVTDTLLATGLPGACVPKCILDKAAETDPFINLIGQSTCEADERCVFCNDPFANNASTGVCD